MAKKRLFLGINDEENGVNWRELAQQKIKFCFVDDFILDDTGDLEELADALSVNVKDLKNNPGIKITPKRVKIIKEFPITLKFIGIPYTEIEIAGMKLELLIAPNQDEYIEVEILDQ